MPEDRTLKSFGFVYGRSGTARGTTTSSAIFVFATGFANRVVSGFASDARSGLRNVSDTLATYDDLRWQTPDGVRARFRVHRFVPSLGATAVMAQSDSTAITGVLVNWQGFGY